MRPEEFIPAHLTLEALPFWPEISLYQPHARSGLGSWLAMQGASTPPYWAYCWAGGAALALYLRDHPELVANKTVLDFGAGSGLLSIIAAKLGAAAVFVLETDPIAGVATRLNASANAVPVTLVPTLLHTDIVLAGDVFYAPEVAQETLKQLRELAQTGSTVLIGDPFRAALPLAELETIAEYRVPDMGSTEPVPAGIFTLLR